MSLAVAILIIVVLTSVSVVTMLLVRRRAPEGSYFADGDRAAGVFGVLATGFSVLLGFVVFLAFTSYDDARSGAETEAAVVAQQFETAQLLPAPAAATLSSQLVCYARSVVGVQWKLMESGKLGEQLNPWATQMFNTVLTVDPQTPSQQAAFGKWLDQTSDREDARNDRIHGAVGVIPTPLWLVLFFTGAAIVIYMLFFADSAERAVVQALMMGVVVAVLASTMLLLQFLDHPFHAGLGGLEPVAMRRTLIILDQDRQI